MPLPPERAAAYTRTGILRKFLEQLSDALPQRVDNAFAQQRLGLKGGDVRAFLQSLRVLGLTDAYGVPTERARRARSGSQRSAIIREALQEAYPELFHRWESQGGMPREEVEDFFKVEYGLSTSSAGPAAKLFSDLMREYGLPLFARATELSGRSHAETSTPLPAPPPPRGEPAEPAPYPMQAVHHGPTAVAPGQDVRLAALDAIKSSLRIDINAEWDPDRIRLVFDRMERLMDRVLSSGG